MTRGRTIVACWALIVTAPNSALTVCADEQVAAIVNGEPIHVGEVDRLERYAIARRKVDPSARPLLRAQLLERLIDERLVLEQLTRTKQGASKEQIAKAAGEFLANLKARGRTLPEFLSERDQSDEDWRRDLAFQVGWKAYLNREITDEALSKYFDENRRQFDGTELAVSQILLAKDSDNSDDLLEQASRIRAEVVRGAISFADAAKKYSDSPSKVRGGAIGSLPRHGVMSEEFSAAAFRLKVGEISPPVVSPHGVHLIQCTKDTPGDKDWTDVRLRLESALAKSLFAKIATESRRTAQIRYLKANDYRDKRSGQVRAPE